MTLECGHPEACWNGDDDDPHCEWCRGVSRLRDGKP